MRMSATATTAGVAGTYLHVGVFSISLANATIIAAMIVVFVLALVIPFPGPRGEQVEQQVPEQRGSR